jgi:4-hydroxysphinganine ceramide fatty acyl 2-hydroxylase
MPMQIATPNTTPAGARSAETDPSIPAAPARAETRFVCNDDASCRMFRSDLQETLSHVRPWIPHAIFLPIIAVSLVAVSRTTSPAKIGAFVLVGLFLWTLLEYLIHRSIFHPPQWIEDDTRRVVASLRPDQAVLPALPTVRHKFYFIVHGVHHDYPNDSTRLVMPPTVSIPLAALFFLAFLAIFGGMAPAVFSGFLAGYLVYDTMHFAAHHASGRSLLVRSLKRRHFRHHYADSTHDFGVSSPLWDLILHTRGTAETARSKV